MKEKSLYITKSLQKGEIANQILSSIDYKNIKKNPKIFIKMSDIDVLHLAINTKTELFTFHNSNLRSKKKFGHRIPNYFLPIGQN